MGKHIRIKISRSTTANITGLNCRKRSDNKNPDKNKFSHVVKFSDTNVVFRVSATIVPYHLNN